MARNRLIMLGIILLIVVILSLLFFQFFQDSIITGDSTSTAQYSFTKAICNETNFCQDYEVSCNGKSVVSMRPITGAVVQYSEDWNDPRTDEEISKTCN